MGQAHGVKRHHAFLNHAAAAEEAAEVIADGLEVVEVAVEERQPHAFLLDRADGEDAEIAAGQLEDRVPRRRHMGAVGHQRSHVLDREPVGKILPAPAHHVEGMGGVDAPRVDLADLGDDLEPARLIARVERAGKAIVAAAMGDELPGGRRLALLRIAGEALVYPIVMRPGPELEAMRDPFGHDEKIALAVLDGPEDRLERAAPAVDEEHQRRRMMLEEVVHWRGRRRDTHGDGGIGHQPRHAAVDVARLGRLHDIERVVSAAEGAESGFPVGGELPCVQHARLVGQPVRGWVEVIGMGDLPGEAAPAMLLLVDMADQRAGMRSPRDDADLGHPAEVFEFLHGKPPHRRVARSPGLGSLFYRRPGLRCEEGAVTPHRFIVDTMLGRLARWLRAMGYDTLYPGQAADRQLLQIARAEERILITRDRMLARLAHPQGCLITAEQVDEQIREAIAQLALAPAASEWLSRCLECNARLEPRDTATLSTLVPDHVLRTQREFMGCPGCGRIYWGGSHAERMLERLGRLLGGA